MVVISIYYSLCNAEMRGDITVHWQSHDALAIDAVCYTCSQSISLNLEGDDPKSLLRAACSHGRAVLLSIVEKRSQLHSLIKVSQRLITIEFYIRWPTGPWPAQISLLVVVFLPTSNQEQQQSSSANVDPTLFISSDIILSRILPPTNNDIGNQQFVNFDLVDHDRTWWGYIDHHENWWSDVCWNDGVTLILHSAVIPALEPTSSAATTLLSGADIISLLIHRCSPAPI